MSMRPAKLPTESTSNLQLPEESKDEVTEEKLKNTSPKEKLIAWFKLITIEPVLFLYLFASTLALGAGQNMNFEMACRVNSGLNDTLCSNYTTGINHVKIEIATAEAWSSPISSIIPGVLVLCFSTFSDRYKIRKPFILLPVLGEVFSCIGLLLCSIYVNAWPVAVYYIFSIILPACFGGVQTMLMAIFSYISDISTVEERTTRVGTVEIVSLILTPIGPALGGILFLKIGYYGIFSICGLLFLFGTLYGWLFVKEKPQPIERTQNICIDMFNIKNVVVDIIKILFRKRIGHRRMLLILTYVCYIMIKGPSTMDGAFTRFYAATQFHWHVDKFGYFRSFDIAVHIIGMIVAVIIFTKKYKMPDLMLVTMACCFKIIAAFWFAFGTSVIMFCIGPLISVFSGLFIIGLRSLVTKLVSQSEIAKTQALFAICEALLPLLYSTMYLKFYEATSDIFPGAFFLFTAGLIVPPLIIVLIMHAVYKNDPKEETTTMNEDPNENQKQGNYNEGNDIETSKL